MEPFPLTIRSAVPADAAGVARVYVESWQDTYPGVLSPHLLLGMSVERQTGRWRAAICQGEIVLAAHHDTHGIVGMASLGRARDRSLGFDGEVYTLYVAPSFLGMGAGRKLLSASFAELTKRGCKSCIIWAHAKNNARFFYEAMGGRLVAQRAARMMGDPVPEAGFGWKTLELAEKSAAR
ncbi:MAG TPA: GNAT family N-acetyltransferase [Rhizomicrobium sp.]|nr:GNAT family N-acetyltransferase [Rhizomicrobium sp.]